METLHPREIELGLERTAEVCDRLGLRALPFTIVTVGGTNGKGSTVAMLEHCLHAAGYRVGAYSSPHLVDYNERVRIATEPVQDAELCAAFARIDDARGDISLTYFEFGTLAAAELFRVHEVDIAILEVGLGGRLDAVNIWDADVAIISSIGIDHTEWLGPDRESIGREKAGIFRAHQCAICGDPDPPSSLLQIAEQAGARLLRVHKDFDFERLPEGWNWRSLDQMHAGLPYPAMRGDYQLYNAACVFMALECLAENFPVTMADLRAGLLSAVLPGRFQTLAGRPVRVLDVAHNVQAAQALARTLREQVVPGQTLAVCGMLHDKPIEEVVGVLAPQIDRWHVAGLPGKRGSSTDDMRAALAAAGVSGDIGLHEDIGQAYAAALAEAGDNDRIVAFGSFYTVGAILRQVKNRSGVMAERKPAEEDFNPRHRIVGAVVLVALAVIFLPMLLSDRAPDPEPALSVGKPTPDTKIVVVPVTPPGTKPLPAPIPSEKSVATQTMDIPVAPAAVPSSSATPPSPDAASTRPLPEKTPKPALTASAKPTAAVTGWTVQVGAFSLLENAKRLQTQLKQKGYLAVLDPPAPAKGKTVRVEVGPFKDAASAKTAQARIQKEFGIKGVVRQP